jgi:hypothetical protein
MRAGSALKRLALAARATMLVLGFTGCGAGLDTTYGKGRGTSLNGTAVFAQMLRDRGHEVRTAIRLTDGLADWASEIVRFAPHPGPPSQDEAAWYRNWLAADGERKLIYVVRDFDTVADYWAGVRDGLGNSSETGRREQAEKEMTKAADWVAKLPAKPKTPANSRDWFDSDTGWNPPRVCTKLSGPWADRIDAGAARLTVHEPLKTSRSFVLLEEDGKPLVVEKMIGRGKALLLANGSFLLNEALVNPARRPLAERVVEWADGDDLQQVAFVEGPFVLQGEAGNLTIWALMERIASLRWVLIQVGIAALLAALARAPRLGRPRPDPPSGADRPAEHALALGTLLARAKAVDEARDLLDRYRRWRYPRTSRAGEVRAVATADSGRAQHDKAASPTLI